MKNTMKENIGLTKHNARHTLRIQKKDVVFLVVIIFVAALSFWKAPKGYASADEGFYLAIANRFIKGERIITDEWFGGQFASVLLVPLLYVYQLFAENNEGVILAFRYLYIVVQLLTCTFIYTRIRRHTGAVAALTAFMMYAPFNIMALSYNSMGILFLAAALASLYSDKDKNMNCAAGGLFFAGAVLCNPYLIFLFAVYTIAVIAVNSLAEDKKEKIYREFSALKWNWFLWFICGCILLAIPVLLLLFRSPVNEILSALGPMLHEPDHPSMTLLQKVQQYMISVLFTTPHTIWIMYGFLMLLISWVVCCMHKAWNVPEFRNVIFGTSLFLTALYILDMYLSVRYINMLFWPVNMAGIFAFLTSCRKNWKAFLLFWIPAMLYTFFLHMTSNQTVFAITSASAVATIPSILLIFERLEESRAHKYNTGIRLGILSVLSVMYLTVAVLRLTVTFWDGDTVELNARIPNGASAGIWTEQARADEYQYFLKDTDLIRDQKGQVLYYTTIPEFYLMDQKHTGAYSCWLSGIDMEGDPVRLKQYYILQPEKIPTSIYLPKYIGVPPEMLLKNLNLKAEIIESDISYTLLIKQS